MRRAALLPLIFLTMAATAVASPIPDVNKLNGAVGDYDQGLSGVVSLGYSSVSGNTETSSTNARIALTYGVGSWYHAFSAETIRATKDGKEAVETTTASAQSDYLFNPHNYVFAHVGYSRNEFGGITQRTSEAVGYGFRLLTTPAMIWSIQIGAGARQEETKTGISRNSAIAQLATSYSWQISDNSRLTEDIVVERGDNNTRSESATRLHLKIISDLSLVVSYTIRHNSDVPPDTANTDTYTSVSVEYTF